MTKRRYRFRALLRSRSIGVQLALLVGAAVVVAFALLGTLAIQSTSSALEQVYEASARSAIAQAHADIDGVDAEIDAGARRAGGMFATMAGSVGRAGPGLSKAGGPKPVPVLSVDGRAMNGDTVLVDRFAAATGATAAVWVMRDGEAVRIASSVSGDGGGRSLGAVADRRSAAYAVAASGAGAVERVTRGSRDQVVDWRPVRDSRGRVVGLTSVSFDVTDATSRLRSRLRDVRVGESGRLHVYDARPGATQGTAIVHPDRAAEGQVRLDVRDATGGRAYLREFIERGAGVGAYSPDAGEAGDSPAGTRTAVFATHPGRQWLVVASLPDEEIQVAGGRLLARLSLAAAAACALIALLLFFAIRLTVSKPLAHAVGVADAVAAGRLDLEIHPRGRDEVGALLGSMGRMVERLRDLVGRIQAASDQVERSSRQIAGGSAELARRAETDAGALKGTADSMTQLASMVRRSSVDAEQASKLAERASATASRGGAAVSAVVATMDGITEASRRIADIIGVIDAIAFQTNILALNAAVEAARAGEQGRGFAVVAGEVRALAQRSTAAAREIKSLIGESVARVESGSKQVGEAGRTMDDIVASVSRVTELIVGISSGMSAQTGDLDRLHQAIDRMDRTTQFNAVLVEEAAGAAATMEDEARRLAAALTAFHLKRSAGTAAEPAPRRRGAASAPSRLIPEEATT